MVSKKNPLNKIDKLLSKSRVTDSASTRQAMFDKNMQFFKAHGQEIFNTFNQYRPQSLTLDISSDGKENLKNIKSGELVYAGGANDFCQNQVIAYQQKPTFLYVRHDPKPMEDIFFQAFYDNQIKERYLAKMKKFAGSLQLPIGLFILSGCGLGHHIHALISSLDIRHLCIVEFDKDIFYASLYTFDWTFIQEFLQTPGRSVNLFIDKPITETIASFKTLLANVGLHNAVNTCFYQHLNNHHSQAFYQQVRKDFALVINGFGFLEDEQISLAHSLENIKKQIPAFYPFHNEVNLPPVVIIGNGPSLDKQLDFIKRVAPQAILMVCGSAIGTLTKEKINADIYVAMERTTLTIDLLDELTHETYTKQICLMALNTVPPEVFQSFRKSLIFIKDTDASSILYQHAFKKNIYTLKYANPTCTNTALVMALALGFKKIYLAGVDLGMQSTKQHHARASQYFDGSAPILLSQGLEEADMVVKGNFSDEVKTTNILNLSRLNMQMALNNHKDVHVYNLNDGAYIEGCTPTSVDEAEAKLSQLPAINHKNDLLDVYINKNTVSGKAVVMSNQEVIEAHICPGIKFLQSLKGLAYPGSILNCHTMLDNIMTNLATLKKQSYLAWLMVSGSVLTFTHYLYYAIVADKPEKIDDNYHFILPLIDEFLDVCISLLRDDSLSVHTATLGQYLKKKS